MLKALLSYVVGLRVQARHPQLVRVDDRHGLLRHCDFSPLGVWAAVDFGNGRTAWFPGDQVVLLSQGERL
ncbi:hypothetical protein GCM10023191_102340 [Actinoallomurus oryzae]|uniref:Uncharacterized protein n=1 Tax=Actinoallomurus oryzae TaxID=502180 RepID=A0ABP8RAE9_9ACTN